MSRKASWISSDAVARVVMGVVCLSLVLTGLKASLSDDMSYENYWGGVVFGPVAVVVGLFGLVVAVFLWHQVGNSPKKLRGRAARKARQAERHRSAIDDFDKPWTGG